MSQNSLVSTHTYRNVPQAPQTFYGMEQFLPWIYRPEARLLYPILSVLVALSAFQRIYAKTARAILGSELIFSMLILSMIYITVHRMRRFSHEAHPYWFCFRRNAQNQIECVSDLSHPEALGVCRHMPFRFSRWTAEGKKCTWRFHLDFFQPVDTQVMQVLWDWFSELPIHNETFTAADATKMDEAIQHPTFMFGKGERAMFGIRRYQGPFGHLTSPGPFPL